MADIEDLLEFGKEYNVCPYYLVRESLLEAELIVAPYNYVIDGSTRRSQGLSVARNILIFDEAHNVEKSAEEAASFELGPDQLSGCIDEMDRLLGVVSADEQVRPSRPAEWARRLICRRRARPRCSSTTC